MLHYKKIQSFLLFFSQHQPSLTEASHKKNFGHLFGGLANECASSNRRFASMVKRMTTTKTHWENFSNFFCEKLKDFSLNFLADTF